MFELLRLSGFSSWDSGASVREELPGWFKVCRGKKRKRVDGVGGADISRYINQSFRWRPFPSNLCLNSPRVKSRCVLHSVLTHSSAYAEKDVGASSVTLLFYAHRLFIGLCLIRGRPLLFFRLLITSCDNWSFIPNSRSYRRTSPAEMWHLPRICRGTSNPWQPKPVWPRKQEWQHNNTPRA